MPHLSQFLSFHLMEATGRQNFAIIKHGLCNSHATVGCLPCHSLPLAQCLTLSFLTSHSWDSRWQTHISATSQPNQTLSILSLCDLWWYKWIPLILCTNVSAAMCSRNKSLFFKGILLNHYPTAMTGSITLCLVCCLNAVNSNYLFVIWRWRSVMHIKMSPEW